MKISQLLTVLLVAALAAWGIQVLHLRHSNAIEPARIKDEGAQERRRIPLAHSQAIRDLEQKYEEQKYLASGDTVYDRIFNTPDQTIVDLIKRISRDAFPGEWSCDVKVEEFTHFILLIYLPHNERLPATDHIVNSLRPVLKYCGWCLSDVAVFDQQHKSYLFFDKAILSHIKSEEYLSPSMERKALQQGQAFTRFNSVTVQCEKYETHLLIPIQISGPNGIVGCRALLDTGASTTMLSTEIVSETGWDNLQSAPRRTFSTVNGTISCPIVHREVNVGGLRKNLEVAVNQQDQLTLLGMNYFEGMDYIIDFGKSVIHMWEK
jgi:predicted aspartyl protease